MSYSIFLDDFRSPKDTASYMPTSMAKLYRDTSWFIVRNFKEFVECVMEHGPDIGMVSFDHDLDPDHYDNKSHDNGNTGYDCAKWLIHYLSSCDYDMPNLFLIHSMNLSGSMRIWKLLTNNTNAQVVRIDFGSLDFIKRRNALP